MENLLNEFKKFKCQFVSVKGYESKTSGEVSNYVINTGISYENLMKKDIEKLKSISFEDQLMEEARRELLKSLEGNLDVKTRSLQSTAQREAYEYLCNGVKRHVETQEVFVLGYEISKTVLTTGVFKEVKSKPLTLAKRNIEKLLNMSTPKYRLFSIGNIQSMRMQGVEYEFVNTTGSTIIFSDKEINQ